MSFPSESDMMSKELQNSDLINVNLMTDVFKIIVKYRRKIIAKYRLMGTELRSMIFTFVLLSSLFVSLFVGKIPVLENGVTVRLSACMSFRSSRSQKFFKISALKNFAIFTKESTCVRGFLNNIAGLEASNFIKKTLKQVLSCEY